MRSRCAMLNALQAWAAVEMTNTLKKQGVRDLFIFEHNGQHYRSGMALQRDAKAGANQPSSPMRRRYPTPDSVRR
jgi:hypothetical protein